MSRPQMELSKEGAMPVLHARIAAEFEHCMQLFHALCSAMEANSPTWSTKIALISEYRRSLLNWGCMTGAAGQSLDHGLRKNSRLRDQVLELLEEFNEALRSILDDVQMTAVPLLSPAMIEVPSQSYFDILTGSNVGIQTFTVSEQALQSKLEMISATLDRLQRLVPSLDHPFPRDIFQPGMLQNDEKEDFNIATKMFPKASTAVRERLGRANWQRRCFLRHVRAIVKGEKTFNNPSFGSSVSAEHVKVISTQTPSFPPTPQKFTIPEYRSVFSRKTSISETMSNTGTIFSKPESVSEYTAGTSIADVEELVKPRLLPVPNPPATLTSGTIFQCPYCAQDIHVGDDTALRLQDLYDSLASTTSDSTTVHTSRPPPQNTKAKVMDIATNAEWVTHVYADLEPYICTFDICQQAQMTFATREEWVRHEMEGHRSSKVWYCQTCDEEWTKQETFEDHLQTMHNLDTDSSAIITQLCEKQTGPSSDLLNCQLCTFTSTTPDSLVSHVAQHLEQLALTSIEEEEDDRSRDEVRLSTYGQVFPSQFARNLAWVESLISAQTPSLFRDGRHPDIKTPGIRASDTDQLPKTPGKLTRNQSRPAGLHRGPSYTYQIRAREQKIAETRLDLPRTQEVPITQTVRTLAPPRNTDFVGRINDMASMHSSLTKPGNICILSGVGGLGKSALATEYTYRFETAYSCIFWVQAETPMICADTYSQIALQVDPTGKDQMEERLITLGREFLETTSKRWLLVFDNVDQWFDLQRFLPTDMSQTTGSVLVTTQLKDMKFPSMNVKCTTVDLGVLPLEESRRLLLSSASLGHNSADLKAHPEYKLAGDIAKMAARLPLALSLIAGFVLVSDCSLAEFVELWKERQENMQVAQSPTDNDPEAEKAMETAWNIGLRAVTTDARELLNILAFLDSDTIQKSLLVGEHQEPLLRFLHASQPGRYRRMTSELRKRRLISVEDRDGEEMLSIHRKLQARILHELNHKDNRAQRERVFNQVFHLVRNKFPEASPVQIPEPEKWPVCKKFLPHVLSIRRLALGSVIDIAPSVKLARLFSDGGIDLWERGLTNEGLELLKSAEAMLDQLTVDEELLRADIHVIVSLLLQDAGMSHIAECKDRIWTALQIRLRYQERCAKSEYTKNDEILLHNAWADYACVLLQYNNFEEAEPIFEKCLAKYKEWDVPENIPYEYAKYYHHVAFCRMYRGEFAEAVYLAEQGLHWVESATGKDSAAATRWKFDLACVVFQAGDLERALELHEEVLVARLKLHGKFGFLTMQSTYAAAATHAALGDLVLAEAELRQILELEEIRPGSCSEAALARTQFHLSQMLDLTLQNKDTMTEKASTDATTTDIGQVGGDSTEVDVAGKESSEIEQLVSVARRVLEKPYPLGKLGEDDNGKILVEIPKDHELAKFDYQQPIFDGRFTGRHILEYVGRKNTK